MAKKEVKENKQKGHYFKDMKAELKKVIWPTPKQLINNTLAVIAFTIIIAVIVFILDLCFNAITENGITKMQEKVKSSYQTTNNETDGNTTTNSSNEENSSNTQVVESNSATNNTTNNNTSNKTNTNAANNTKNNTTQENKTNTNK